MTPSTVQIPMPHMGVSVEEGTVLTWHKAEGDTVAVDEVICEISTDKVDTEVLSPAEGVLHRIVAAAGETVAVGAPLAELAVSGGAAPAPSQERAPAQAAPHQFDPVAAAEAVVPAAGRDGAAVSSPVARRLAAEHGVDLAAVRGSGIRGRIRKADVLAAVESEGSAPASAVQPAPEPPTPVRGAGALPRGYEDVPNEIAPLSRQRSLMAEHMTRSRRTAAHMTTEADVDMSAVDLAREELSAPRVAAGQRRLTALSFVARAACAALAEFPDLNATFDGERLIRWGEVNMGIAVDTPDGLIVPVIRRCDGLTAAAIGDAIAEVAELARARRLTPDHIRAGTFTISNPGSVGGISAMAIINQPQVGILGTPAVVRRPIVVTDDRGAEAIGIRPVMRLALTFDHRVIDGAYATRCVVRIKQFLETWEASAYA
jgi:pyruvate dehydrogenase E2 component (dihydrolipoamide acetyltransferase)